jgi:hypothetical protein
MPVFLPRSERSERLPLPHSRGRSLISESGTSGTAEPMVEPSQTHTDPVFGPYRGPLPATHWDRSAPVPRMPSWHDGAYRRPCLCQARRNFEHLMNSAPILPCLIANLKLTPTLRNSCASGLALARPHVAFSLPRRAISIPGGEIPGSFVSISFPIEELFCVPGATTLPCSLSKHIA